MTVSKNISTNLKGPQGLFVTDNGDIYIDNGASNHRVEKWTLNATSGIPVMNVNGTCHGLFVDTNNTLYCSIGSQHKVVKVSLNSGATTPELAAGTGINGLTSDMLNAPRGIFVDRDFNLYVADCNNHRIQLFRSNQSNTTTIVGSTVPVTLSISCPIGIMFDADGYLFIVDNGGGRIIGSDASGYRYVIGCSGMNTSSSQLKNPFSISFDPLGNLYVADQDNNRTLKFLLSTNSCGKCSTFPSTDTYT